MAWVRIHDAAMSHPKIVGLSDAAFRAWVWGLSYAQTHLTDGQIPAAALDSRLRKRAVDLLSAGLWEQGESGFIIHDFLHWNDSRETVNAARQLSRDRKMFLKNPELRNWCRYCGCAVNWLDRKGPHGATYDHVVPYGDPTVDNLVVCCRSCNSRKRNRTPEQAGMELLEPKSRSHLDSIQINPSIHATPRHATVDKKSPSDSSARRFDEFWSAYPKKTGKDAARKAFDRRKVDDALLAAMLAAIAVQVRSKQWQDEGGRFIPNPATWLNQGRWQDEGATVVGPRPVGAARHWTPDDCPHDARHFSRQDCEHATLMEQFRAGRTA